MALPDPAARWRDGASLPFLGHTVTLCMATTRDAAGVKGDVLHLPLPPGATPRQIQDGVEAWLRQEAATLIGTCLAREAQRARRPLPQWSFSFAARGGWTQQHADGSLRFNWRLVEQPREAIEQIVSAAFAALPGTNVTADFWGMPEA